MRKRIIINADDLGHPDGTVEATIALHQAGVVTSTTVMVNQPHWPEAAPYLRDHPELGAGVHLVMNDGCPLLSPEQVPSLVDAGGCFRDGTPLLLRYGRLRTAELKAEWRAQIEKFIADTGRQPDHLDLHCHYPYAFSAWFRVSLELARDYGHIPVRMPFDDALDSKAPAMAAGMGFSLLLSTRLSRSAIIRGRARALVSFLRQALDGREPPCGKSIECGFESQVKY